MSEDSTSRRQDGFSAAPSSLMGALVAAYPELSAFTPGATLMEVKLMYGLSNLEDVRALGRARLARAGDSRRRAAQHAAPGEHPAHSPQRSAPRA